MTTDSTDKQIRRALLRINNGQGEQVIVVGGEKFYVSKEKTGDERVDLAHIKWKPIYKHRIQHNDHDGIPWVKWFKEVSSLNPDSLRDYCNEILTEILLDR